jgi:hypothetical protein
MLMITRSQGDDQTQTFKLEGKLLGPWIGELELACGSSRMRPGGIYLDLAGLTFIEAEGVRLLESLIRDGAQVVACSGFVAEMLHQGWH